MSSSRSGMCAWTTPSSSESTSTPIRPGKSPSPAAFSWSSVSSIRSTLHFGPMAKPQGEKLIVDNRRARHDYHLTDKVEAGLVLAGTEVKALRDGKSTLQQAYAEIRDGEAWLVGLHIPEYGQGNRANHEPDRPRKLLLHRREIDRLHAGIRERGFTIVPTRLYFREGRVKVELALARGKELLDKRRDIAARDAKRQIERELKARR